MPSDPSDWDPLPELGAAQYPGESAALGPRQPARATATAAAATAGAAGTGPTAAQKEFVFTNGVAVAPVAALQPRGDARADAMLKGMQQPAETKSKLASVMLRSEPTPVRRVTAPKKNQGTVSPAAVVAVGLPAIEGRDARQDEPWFRALPAAEQGRLQDAWAKEQQQVEVAPQLHRQELLEWFWVAYVVFFIAALPLMLVEGLAGFVRMAMAGCVTGMVWQMVPRTRLWCVISAVSVYCLIVIVPRVGELSQSPFDLLVSLGGACIVGYLASLALHEELHRRPLVQ